jgi:hypothetical protein
MKALCTGPLRAACLPVLLILGACGAVEAIRQEMPNNHQSSGTIKADAALAAVALSVNQNYVPNPSSEHGDTVQGAAAPEAIQRFATDFARHVDAELPNLLRQHGVAVRPPGRGMPLLRFYVSTYRANCRYTHDPCQTELRIDAALLEEGGTRTWWYNKWVVMDEMDQAAYREFYSDLLETMRKDQVVVE